MIGRHEIVRSVTGAWRLFTGKPDALSHFDTSMEGFWRSFQAILLIAPVYALMALVERNVTGGEPGLGSADDGTFWTIKAVTLAADWLTFPILLAAVAGQIGIRHGYAPYITVRNWATVIMIVPFAVLALIEGGFGLAQEVVFIPLLAALAFSLRFGYLIARATLRVDTDVAIAIVALDFLVSVSIALIIGRLSGFEPTS